MTKAQLKKSHDAMARFILSLCRFSDTAWHGQRDTHVEKQHLRARRLLKNAGVKYEPKQNNLA